MAAGQVGKVALTAVDHVAVKRFADAEALYERAISARPHADAHGVATEIIRRVARELGAAGAVSGAMAASPMIGTSVSLATGAADVGLAFGRLTSMVLAVGLAHGADLSNPEERRRHAYAVLSGSGDQLTPGERKAGELKKQLGQQALGTRRGRGPTGGVGNVITTKVAEKMVAKLATQEAAIKIGSLLPLGLGAGVGAVGNRALVFSVGRTAVKYFGSSQGSSRGSSRPTGSGTRERPLRPVGQISSGGGTAVFTKGPSRLQRAKSRITGK